MADAKPTIFSIPVQRAFADALAAGLIARYADGALGLANGLIILPSNRARSAVQAAFVRASGSGLLMPRLAVIGDADLDESVALALDPIDESDAIPPAIDALKRRLMLAGLIEKHVPAGEDPITGAAAFQLAEGLGRVIDQLHYEEVAPARLADIESALGDLAGHWQASWRRLSLLVDQWPKLLATTGHIDRADRRNRLLERVSRGWRVAPPARFVVAAGVTTAAPAIARLLRTVADLPQGMVVLPGLDIGMAGEEWEALGPVKTDPEKPGDRPLETHPQYHLKLLLGRMGVSRDEVQSWDAASPFDGPDARASFTSLLFAPADYTARWQQARDLGEGIAGVTAAVFGDDGQEAQGIALMMRAALETPARTAALVTPDRGLATRVAAALARWDISVDDSAGQPLGQTPPGALLLALAEFAAAFDPVRLIALLGHPLVRAGDTRLGWLDQVRRLDLVLRGPGLVPGWGGVTARIAALAADPKARGHSAAQAIEPWWDDVVAGLGAALAPFEAGASAPPSVLLGALQSALGWLTGDGVWSGHAGRALSEIFDRWALAKGDGPALVAPDDFPAMLTDLLSGESVRPPYGGHPRLFIWGLLEARLQRADVMILGGLDEGRWPQQQSPDPWLAPGIRRMLGLAAPERQQGAAAHDFAGAFAARKVVVTRAMRSGGDPAVASRFWLRLAALAGELPEARVGGDSVTALAAALDVPAGPIAPARMPEPRPPVDARPDHISVTGVDLLAKDPYAFYAGRILRLSVLDPLRAGPDPRWLGTRVHAFMEDWQRAGATPDALEVELGRLLDDPALDALARAFWFPRIEPALRWAAGRVWEARIEGREPIATEASGMHELDGIRLSGKADRIDRLSDGSLAIVDYKTGAAPSGSAAAGGLDNQLGLLGLLAEMGKVDGVAAGPINALEYWSLKADRAKAVDGSIAATHGSRRKLKTAEEAVARAYDAFAELTASYLLGDGAFAPGDNAKRFTDYDQLMRRDEWFGRGRDLGGELP
ncbi:MULTISPECIES: double-strand break repair protein AddB [unclassified Sphingopyxis]|jgi:ATP-dependent helicase/nuclease subunit B|uniref:double-strand break repair protein AddB n=1 Tax=unclassified Sphingopyxis TaxID=2614943 RepID=UPI0006C46235|nr:MULTISPECIES: double-strand break repair protein AddB [unclassified Sphingopyxis]USI76315.1 double-strand break repair protein AddB [Sphingopyxis sp. USTB-05]GAO76968.1 ATP-dependent nuclease subunit B [Sphingopyxis sp. C-1]